jgi:hypothetical protein
MREVRSSRRSSIYHVSSEKVIFHVKQSASEYPLAGTLLLLFYNIHFQFGLINRF